jgi:hypothetical protein
LAICRITLLLVICLNFFAICVLSLATFYMHQMFEKQREGVLWYRLKTQSYRKYGQFAVIVSIPLFLIAVALYYAEFWIGIEFYVIAIVLF